MDIGTDFRLLQLRLYMTSATKRILKYVAANLIVFFLCYSTGLFGRQIALILSVSAPIWPPAGISLAAVLLMRTKPLLGIWCAIFLIVKDVFHNIPVAAVAASGATFVPWFEAHLLKRLKFEGTFENLIDVISFIIVSAVVGPIFYATLGVAMVRAADTVSAQNYEFLWWSWLSNSGISNLVLVPFIYIWSRRYRFRLTFTAALEGITFFTGLILLTIFIFQQKSHPWTGFYLSPYLTITWMLWAYLRLTQRASFTATLVIWVISTYYTLKGYGPFLAGDSSERLIQLQAFIRITALSGLIIPAIVSERKKTQKQFYSLADTMSQLAWSCHSNGVTYYVNKQWTEYTGQPRVKCHHFGWLDIIHSSDKENTLNAWNEAVLSKKKFFVEHRLLRHDGEYLWHLTEAEPLFNDERVLIGWTGTCTNIENQKRSEESQRFLSEATKLLAISLDYQETLDKVVKFSVKFFNGWCVVYFWDNQKLTRAVVAHSDPYYEEFTRKLTQSYPIDTGSAVNPFRVLQTGTPVFTPQMTDEILTSTCKDPQLLQSLRALNLKSYMCLPIKARGKTFGAISFSSAHRSFDQHDFKLAEELAVRFAIAIENTNLYREAQRAVQAREDVVAIVSHDLKNPLTAIQLNTELLQKLLTTDKTNPIFGHLERIHQQTVQMKVLIQNILDATKIDSGRFLMEPAEVSAKEILADISDLFTSLAQAKSISLRFYIGKNGCVLFCDRQRIIQVLSNLVGNAIKFTQKSGTVEIRVTRTNQECRFSITDNGPGISDEELPYVFNHFWQAKKTQKFGTGLGLFIAKGIIEAHGGKIWVESKIHQGTTFHFTVPMPTKYRPALKTLVCA